MFDNLMYAIRTEKQNGKVVGVFHITPAEYERDFFKNLYYREVNDNRANHRCCYGHERGFDCNVIKWETYGNGYKCEWELVPIPNAAGFREKNVIEHMTYLEFVEDGEHELVRFHAAVPDGDGYEHQTCTWDETTGKFVG